MNLSTLIGMLSGIAIVVLSVMLTAADAWSFINLPGLAIVLGGTFAATLLAYPLRDVVRVFKILWIVLRNEKMYAEDDQRELVEVARQLVQGRIANAEDQLNQVQNPFLKTGLQLLIDRTPTEDIAELLEWRILRTKLKERAEAQVYRTMATFAPAFGMLGTLVGLVNMLHGMGQSSMSEIGVDMAFALLTTLYGVVLANMLFKPIAIKFERRTESRVQLMNMILEGILLIARGRSPAYIREYLATFFAHVEDELDINEANDIAAKNGLHEGLGKGKSERL
ncbi:MULTISPECIES: motility protein A [Pseudidiomarina]|uniref:Chemotaxis protein MotA n=3 Tax=Pseudidiomarina TaxID=2800384 RepID=A0A368UN43_9GAMM|nr:MULTISPECIES: MotA/TolQ/ExbB proton channel family protein [Pseudidiomarina]MDT7526440.1 MotA/TolQ/ExbB proton channel family protein [Pseudidiomarina sp. GXY010]MDX1526820.1 MotA/TolQ/ExbB proton channel family protein [Pseudidiomarina maritima]PWW09752.1 chemotaxis protein MotA [Pseudidiomarina maritima]RBP87536.1 chemotaxis protein MotA [Pseudidiomarina tainanensis]RCW29595.1 chemotaxis protein MotA [Pseudidiomarina tainanensis]